MLLVGQLLSVDSFVIPKGTASFPFNTKDADVSSSINSELLVSTVPLVFIPGMKGTHLAYNDTETGAGFFGASEGRQPTKRRAWLTIGGLLNLPPLPKEHLTRNIDLPLTYNSKRVQDKGNLFPDGIVEHIIQIGENKGGELSRALELFPFYGHVTKDLEEMNERFKAKFHGNKPKRKKDLGIKLTSRSSTSQSTPDCSRHCRPTAVFAYDWRRPVSENSEEFHNFCEEMFPGQTVQVCGHSMGGLISYTAMRKYPEKFKAGGVFAGVPFGTGIQYLQDVHRGYYTEINRCQQYTPISQCSFSSHWIFFPTNESELENSFVDVSNTNHPDGGQFQFGDKVAKTKPNNDKLKPAVPGEKIDIDFYKVNDWEEHKLGIFDPKQLRQMNETKIEQFRNHLTIQFDEAKEWRKNMLRNLTESELQKFPDLVLCATNTVPTVNQILRRKKRSNDTGINVNMIGTSNQDAFSNPYDYDYTSGRRVPGDGRIDYDKAFPDNNVPVKKVQISSVHSKQMCRQSEGKWIAIL